MKDDKISESSITPATAATRSAGRRGFLAGAGVAGVAGAAVLATRGTGRPVADEAAAEAVPPKALANRGYHETDHVRKYYDTTKV